jgi:hypothetical protein
MDLDTAAAQHEQLPLAKIDRAPTSHANRIRRRCN